MALDIQITVVDDTDYDGNAVQVKEVHVLIDGKEINVDYSYDSAVADATIESEVQADLTDRGYTWT